MLHKIFHSENPTCVGDKLCLSHIERYKIVLNNKFHFNKAYFFMTWLMSEICYKI